MAGYGTNATKIAAMKPSSILSPGDSGGKVRCIYDEYTGTTAEAGATLTVIMGNELPLGARIVGVTIDCPATGITINVGDAEDTDRYISAAAASTVSYCDNVTAAIGYVVDMTTAATPDNQVLLTLSAACAAVKVTLAVFYVVE